MNIAVCSSGRLSCLHLRHNSLKDDYFDKLGDDFVFFLNSHEPLENGYFEACEKNAVHEADPVLIAEKVKR